MVIWPEASSAQNSMAAVSAQGSTVWVLILRLNSSCRRSIAFEVLIDFHWLGGKRVKVKSLSPASSRLSATARLAAILAADVAGYSRLMGRNEEETVRDLEAHQAVILSCRSLPSSAGPSSTLPAMELFAQFPSAVRAVAMQKTMAERNFDIPAERRNRKTQLMAGSEAAN
jgi:hypothetical protein